MREKIKKLWEICFDDSKEYVDMYFKLRYNKDVNIAIHSGEEIIAALQMLPYPMSFGNKKINTAYISGACTHPEHRSKGVMRELLSQSFAQMLQNDVALSTLIPGEPWLFDYYARNGFAPVFKYKKSTFNATAPFLPQEGYTLEASCEFQEAIYNYLDRKLKERPYCIEHTLSDFKVILADLQISQGSIYVLKQRDNIVALAIAYPTDGNNWYLGEILSDTDDTNVCLLQYICKELQIPSVEVYMPSQNDGTERPLGMARIINAQTILQLYAATFPELEMKLHLTDEQIGMNNGYYYLNNGTCTNSAKRLPGSHLALTIGELTEKVFAPLNPYMSLMLN